MLNISCTSVTDFCHVSQSASLILALKTQKGYIYIYILSKINS